MVSGPLGLDLLTQIVDVQWEGGLAVEFCPDEEGVTSGEGEPSYIHLVGGVPDFSKAVISLWFRVPMASVVAASNHNMVTQTPDFFMMQSIIPLLTYGKPQVNKNYQGNITDVAIYHFSGTSDPFLATSSYSAHQSYDVDPCFIGLECSGDGTFRLAFNIQTGVETSYSSIDWVTTAMHFYDPGQPGPGPSPNYPGSGWHSPHRQAIIRDDSYIEKRQPEFFYVTSGEDFDPDRWHHLLLSFDVSGTVSIGHPFASSTCRLWYAVDDEDRRGAENLQPNRDDGDGLDENAIVTSTAYRNSFASPDGDLWLFQNHPVAAPSGTYVGELIPTRQPLGLPAAPKYADAIFRVELAELQVWTGVTLDTGVTANRRAFVDVDGKPVKPRGTKNDPRWPGEKLLGKKPEIMLNGNRNWQIGRNTGTFGNTIDTNGNIEVDPNGVGQFVPVGLIPKFKPEPSLEEDTA